LFSFFFKKTQIYKLNLFFEKKNCPLKMGSTNFTAPPPPDMADPPPPEKKSGAHVCDQRPDQTHMAIDFRALNNFSRLTGLVLLASKRVISFLII
jgi:hypothetical protein